MSLGRVIKFGVGENAVAFSPSGASTSSLASRIAL
jgi:hypothetical protein